jgi:hypothetical protein
MLPKLRAASGLPLQPHPLAATLRCKLAKAALRGNGWGEGVRRPFVASAVTIARMRLRGVHGIASPNGWFRPPAMNSAVVVGGARKPADAAQPR